MPSRVTTVVSKLLSVPVPEPLAALRLQPVPGGGAVLSVSPNSAQKSKVRAASGLPGTIASAAVIASPL